MGFLLLGFLLERVFDMPLDEAAKRFVTAPLHMGRTGYLPSGSDVAPTSIRDENGVLQPGCPLDGNAGSCTAWRAIRACSPIWRTRPASPPCCP